MTDTNGNSPSVNGAAFDDLTLGEVELISTHALGGKSMGDESADALMVAGGMLWIVKRRDDPSLTWDAFKQTARMGDIKAFSTEIESANAPDAVDPTNGRNALAT